MEDFFRGVRICEYCGINIDIPYKSIIFEIHGECWKQYRLHDKVYPMPGYTGVYFDEEHGDPFEISFS